MSPSSSMPRTLLRKMHTLMAAEYSRDERLKRIVDLIAATMNAAVCSIYICRPDHILELYATAGLNPVAVHKTTLRLGEGLVGDIAKHARPLNLSDAPAHPLFAYRPETGEDPYKSFIGVPILHNSHVSGVLVVQNITQRFFTEEESEALQTVAMVLSQLLEDIDTIQKDQHMSRQAHSLVGNGLTEGLAMGHVVRHEPYVEVTRLIADNTDKERTRLDMAVYHMRSDIDNLLRNEDVSHAGEHLDVLETYRYFANDVGWLNRMHDAIETGLTAEAAVEHVNNDMRARLMGQHDQYLRDRMHDFDDLANRLLRTLTGRAPSAAHDKLPRDTILVARTMGPAELLDYDRRKLRGIALEEGAMSAHVAIVARALNIPLVGGVRNLTDFVRDGQEIIIDADLGHVHLNPPSDIIAQITDRTKLRAKRLKRFARLRTLPARTRDGVDIKLDMNAGLGVDVANLEISGAQNIGLFRTELHFMISAHFPRQKEQQDFYRYVIDAAKGRDVVFRTLDIGGDKVLPYIRTLREENPAMGWRAMRIAIDRPGLLRYQLRALLTATAQHKLHLMFPLISTSDEFIKAKHILHEEIARQKKFGHAVPQQIRVGAMLEVPALIWELDKLLPHVDFLSIGTSDLLQFFYASDRSNALIGNRYDILSLSFLRMMRDVATTCTQQKTPISLCGDMLGQPLVAMAMLGVGFTHFSVPATSVGAVKRMIRSVNLHHLREKMPPLLDDTSGDMRDKINRLAQTLKARL